MDSEPRHTLFDSVTFPWWSAKLPADLEVRFSNETDTARDAQIRVWVVIGLAFSWLGFAADVITVPDVWPLSLLLHLLLVTPISVVAFWMLGARLPRWQESLATVLPQILPLLTVMIGFAASTAFDGFRSAIVLSLGILWTNVLVPMRMRDAVWFTVGAAVLGTTINAIGLFRHHAVIDHPEVVVMTSVLSVLSLLARFLAERQSRRSFVSGLQLQIRVEELARSNEALLDMSNTDPLTGLANRRYFDTALMRAWATAASARSSVAVAMIDVDHFKQFNDAAGHLEGDRCLTVVARAIADHIRQGQDIAARFGGEEFVLLMPATDADTAQAIAERVHTAIAALRVFHPGRIGRGFVSVSIGVAASRPEEPDAAPSALLRAADQAMYAAKTSGRDRVVRADRCRTEDTASSGRWGVA